jgi:hypothetical protein
MIKLNIYKILLLILFLFLISPNIHSQINFECGMNGTSTNYDNIDINDFYGLMKPLRSDIGAGPEPPPYDSYFPVLVVFVQFRDDPDLWPEWPTGEDPDYLNKMISREKSYATNWWEAYNPNTQPISDYWLQVSRGKLHVLGKAYSVKLTKNAAQYSTEAEINQEIWDNINAQGIDWTYYDQWKPVLENGIRKFQWKPDGYIDMIYKIYKTRGRSPGNNQAGIACLSGDCYDETTVQVNQNPPEFIKYGYYNHNYNYEPQNSGIMASNSGNKNQNLEICFHEHTHYLFSDVHIVYGRLGYGPGSEQFFSPYEMILLGYMQPTNATINGVNYLQDYSSRDNLDGHILKVPINEQTDECFLITNRSNVSKWDKIMLGDTAIIQGYDMVTPYGKGIYINHIKSGIHFPNSDPDYVQDEECADGFWHMSYLQNGTLYYYGGGYCWQSSYNQFKIFKRDYPVYDNDNTQHSEYDLLGDDKDFYSPQWAVFGQPSQNQSQCEIGLERTFTNSNEYFTFMQAQGDRWDAWRVGYNEVFSPYSSPSTNTWENPTNQNSGIFIYLSSNDGVNFIATLNIYKVDANHSLESILQATPPSRPMGLTLSYTECVNGIVYPVLTWKHNREPDMTDEINHPEVKRYGISRAVSDINSVPGNYGICTDQYFSTATDPTFIDYATSINCLGNENSMMIRYKVYAIDKYQSSSVYSDFVATPADGVSLPDNLKSINNAPKDFKIFQNYPNPFNPVTNIKYDLPKNEFVAIKIYDLLGREIKTLVNEFKNAGSYLVSFNGGEFASGVYFYRIQAGSFVQVKRMVLIK